MSGPIGSPCLTPCAEVMFCIPSGELSERLEVQSYAYCRSTSAVSRLSTVLNALLKSSEVKWEYDRSKVPSRARSTALTTGSSPPLLPTPTGAAEGSHVGWSAG
jgi:hypothetical protein